MKMPIRGILDDIFGLTFGNKDETLNASFLASS
jgi:hypothetical protein